MAAEGQRVVALVQSNNTQPVTALSGMAASAFAGFPGAMPIRLTSATRASVRIAPRHNWSSATLSTRDWLFHPSVTSLGSGQGFALSATTADGRAVVWRWDGRGDPQPMGHPLDAALDPVLLRQSGADRLLFCVKPADWAVYFHDTRYSGQYGPMALPLYMRANGASSNLGPALGVEGVFSFAAAPDGGGGSTLALVAGSKTAPALHVYAERSGNWVRLLRLAFARSRIG